MTVPPPAAAAASIALLMAGGSTGLPSPGAPQLRTSNCPGGSRGGFDRLVDGGRIDGLAVAGCAKRAHIELHWRQRRRGGLLARTHCWDGGNGGGGKTHAAESQKVAAGGVKSFHIAAMLAESIYGLEIFPDGKRARLP